MFVSPAWAQAAGGGGDGGFMTLLPLILIFVVFYFLLIRPQQKKAKEHKDMVEAVKRGDQVVTAGGMVGRITKVGETYVTIEIAELPEARHGQEPQGVEVTFQKNSIQTLLPTGTIKAI